MSNSPTGVDPTVYNTIKQAEATNTQWNTTTANDSINMAALIKQSNGMDPFMAVLFAIMNILNFETDQAGHKVAQITEGQEGVQSAFTYSFNYLQGILAKGGSVGDGAGGEADQAAQTMSWLYGELGMGTDGVYHKDKNNSGLDDDAAAKLGGYMNDVASGYCTEAISITGTFIGDDAGDHPQNAGTNGPNDPGFWTPADLTRKWSTTNGWKAVYPIHDAQVNWDKTANDPTNPHTSPNQQTTTYGYGQLNSMMSGLTSQSKSDADFFSDILNRVADTEDKMGTQENELTKAMVAGSAPK